MEINRQTFISGLQSAGSWIIGNWKYVVGTIIFVLLISVGKTWFDTRNTKGPTVIVGDNAKANLSSDADWILCLYDQHECTYKNAGVKLEILIQKCGIINKCDLKKD